MATLLTKDVFRETRAYIRDRGKARALILGLGAGDVVTVRLKGTRRAYVLPADHIYYQAVKVWAQAERARKAAERKNRRDSRA